MINSLDAYATAGKQAGKAARQKDYNLVSFQQDWFERAVRLETKQERDLARAVFNEMYRSESRPVAYFR